MTFRQIRQQLRREFAVVILNGMISSAPIANRVTVNKPLWVDIAIDWADELIDGLVAREEKDPGA